MNLRKEFQDYQVQTNKVAINNAFAFRGITSPGSSKEFRVPEDIRETVAAHEESSKQSKQQFQFGLPDIDDSGQISSH